MDETFGYSQPVCPLSMSAFVISLRNSRRRDLCRQQLDDAGLPFVFTDAVDGLELGETGALAVGYDVLLNKRLFKREMSLPEIGCYLSHKEVWKQVVAENRAAVILEDDFELDRDFRTQLTRLEKFDLSNFVIKLDSPFSERRLRGGGFSLIEGLKIREHAIVTPRTTGYIIGPKAAARMLSARQRFFRPVDIDMKFLWEHGVAVLATEPPLVRERAQELPASSIAPSRKAIKSKNPLHRFLRNILYQASFKFHVLKRNVRKSENRVLLRTKKL